MPPPPGAISLSPPLNPSEIAASIVPEIADPEFSYAPAPENVLKIYSFMNKVGALKNMPATWQDLFFPEAHGLKGN